MSGKTIVDNSSITNKTNANALRCSINFASDQISLTGSGPSAKCTLSGLKQAVANDEAVTKQQLDQAVESLSTGLVWGDPAVCATQANFDATYSSVNGTLEASANGEFQADGFTPSVGDRILVKNQSVGVENGIYTLTVLGDASTKAKLTRAEDANSAEEMVGKALLVLEGTASAGKIYAQGNRISNLTNDAISFSQISSNIDVNNFQDGLILQGNSVRVNTGANMTITGDKLVVAPASLTSSELASDSVGNLQLAGDAVSTNKIQDLAVTDAKINDMDGDKLANASVDGAIKLAPRSVPSSVIALRAVDENLLADGAVTREKCEASLVDDSLVEGKSLTASVVLADGSITETLFASNSLPESAFKPLSIGNGLLKNNSVTTNKIMAQNVTNAKLARTSGSEAVSEETVQDNAISNRCMASNACDTRVISDLAISNAKLQDNSVNSRCLAELSDLTVVGEIQAGSIVLGNASGGSGTTFSLAKCIFNNINFSADAPIPHGSWTRIANNVVEFPYEDKITSVLSHGSFMVQTNGLSSQVGIILGVRYWKDNGVEKEAFIEPVVAEYKTTNYGVTHPQRMALSGFIAKTSSASDQIIAEVRWYARAMNSGANVRVPANSELIASHTVQNSTSARQNQTYDGSSLVTV